MIKTNHWINILFALSFIVAPAFIGFIFFLPDWNAKWNIDYWVYWLISLAYFMYVVLILFLSIKFSILGYDSLRFNLPISLVFISIFVSYDWHMALRFLFAIFMICIAWPSNMFVDYLIEKKLKNIKNKNKKLKNK